MESVLFKSPMEPNEEKKGEEHDFGTKYPKSSMKPATQQAAQNPRANSVSTTLKYLDSFKPLLLSDPTIFRVALARFEYLASRVQHPNPALDLLTYELSSHQEIDEFFPTQPKGFDMIVQLLSEENTVLGKRISLLDLLTVLVIVLRGSLEEKTKYLFEWYNTNRTGVMTEVEHTVFIMRLSRSLTRIKFLNSIDVTEEDAKHIAFISRLKQGDIKRVRRDGMNIQAADRSRAGAATSTQNAPSSLLMSSTVHTEAKESSQSRSADEGLRVDMNKGDIKFHPGLTKDLFDRWVKYSLEGQVMKRFVLCLDRLVDMLRALDARSDAVGDIVMRKHHHHKNSPSVPAPDILRNIRITHDSPVHVICRGRYFVSMVVKAKTPIEDPATEVYIKCEEIHRVPNPLYPIPFQTMETIKKSKSKAGTRDTPLCCDRVYTLTAFFRNGFSGRNQPPCERGPCAYYSSAVSKEDFMQVHLEGLEANMRYNITIYTKQTQYPQVEVKTLSEGTSEKSSISVLPGALSVSQAIEFINDTPSIRDSDAVVYSGSLCDLDAQIQEALLFAETGVRNTFNQNFVQSFVSCLGAKMYSEFEGYCKLLYGVTSGIPSDSRGYLEGTIAAHRRKQIIYHNGMGPWRSANIFNKIKTRLYQDSIRTDKNGNLCADKDDTTENTWLRDIPRCVGLVDNIRREMEYQYRNMVKPLNPFPQTNPGGVKDACFTLNHGPFEILFLDNNGECDNTLGTTARSLTSLIGAKLSREESSSEGHEQRLVLIMRSPLDIMSEHDNVARQAILQFHKYQSSAKLLTDMETVSEENVDSEIAGDGNLSGIDKEGDDEDAVEIPVMATIVDEPNEAQKKENMKAEKVKTKSTKKSDSDEDDSDEDDSDEDDSDEDDSDEDDSDEDDSDEDDSDEDDSDEESEEREDISDLDDEDLSPKELATRNKKRRLIKEEEERVNSEYVCDKILPEWIAEEAPVIAKVSIEECSRERAFAKRKIMNGGYVPTDFWKVDRDAANFRYKMRKYNEAHGLPIVYDDDYEEGNDIIDDREEGRDANIKPIDNTDGAFKELISVLLLWLSSAPSESLRSVHLVSTGWENGANFEIYSKTQKLRIIHENLLAATSSYDMTKCDSRGYRRRGYTDEDDIFIPDFEYVGLTTKEKLAQEDKIRVETLLDRIKSSLPEDCTLSLLNASQLRSLVLEYDPENTESSKIVQSYLPINLVQLTSAQSGNEHLPLNAESTCSVVSDDMPPLEVRSGPNITRLQSEEALISASLTGYGRAKCTIYELPFEMNYQDALCVCATNRSQLLKIGSVTKRCIKKADMFFHFKNLIPYTTYCVCLDLYSTIQPPEKQSLSAPLLKQGKELKSVKQDDAEATLSHLDETVENEENTSGAVEEEGTEKGGKEKKEKAHEEPKSVMDPSLSEVDPVPIIAHFRTLSDAKGMSSSMIISTVSDSDLALPSFTISKIDELLTTTRPPAATVHLLYNLSGIDDKDTLGPEKPGRMDLQKLYRRANISLLEPQYKTSSSDQVFTIPLEKFDGILHNAPRNMDSSVGLHGAERDRVLEAFGSERLLEDIRESYSYRILHSLLNVNINGRFCRITPRDSSWECLRKVADIMSKMDIWHPDVQNVTLFVHRPLLRYLKKSQLPRAKQRFYKPTTPVVLAADCTKYIRDVSHEDDPPDPLTEPEITDMHSKAKWSFDCRSKKDHDDSEEYLQLCSFVIRSIIEWKAKKHGRDCQIIAIAQVKTVKVAVFGYNLRKRSALRARRKVLLEKMIEDAKNLQAIEQQLANDELTLGTAEVISLGIMTSSVAYTAEDSNAVKDAVDDGTIATNPTLNIDKAANVENDDATIATMDPSIHPDDPESKDSEIPDSDPKAAEIADQEGDTNGVDAQPKSDDEERVSDDDFAPESVPEGDEETGNEGKFTSNENNPEDEKDLNVPDVSDVFKATKPVLLDEDGMDERGHALNESEKLEDASISPDEVQAVDDNLGSPEQDLGEVLESRQAVNSDDHFGDGDDGDDDLDELSVSSAEAEEVNANRRESWFDDPLVTIRHIILPVWTGPEEFPNEFPHFEEVATMTLPASRRARLEKEGRIAPLPPPEPKETEREGGEVEGEAKAAEPAKKLPPSWNNPEEDDAYLFPSGTYTLDGPIDFKFDRDPTNLEKYNISPLLKRIDLYGKGIDITLPQAEIAVYLFDIFIRPGEGSQPFVPIVEYPLIDGNASVAQGDVSVAGSADGSLLVGSVGTVHTLEELQSMLDENEQADEMSVHHFPKRPVTHVYDQHFHAPMPVPVTNYPGKIHSSEWHMLLPRTFVSTLDNADMIVGPVIGEVSTTSARILFEFNMDMRELAIVLHPVGRNNIDSLPLSAAERDMLEGDYPVPPVPEGEGEGKEEEKGSNENTASASSGAITGIENPIDMPRNPKWPKKEPKPGFCYNDIGQEVEVPIPNAIIIQKNIKAYKAFTITFENLKPNTPYTIHIPELRGRDKLGCIRTRAEFNRFSEILLCGGTPIDGLDSVDSIIHHMKTHQISDVRNILREMNILYPSYVKSLYNERTEEFAPQSVVGVTGITNEQKLPHNKRQVPMVWSWMAEYTAMPVSDYSMTIHLGSQTFLSHHFNKMVENLLEKGRRLKLPLFDAGPVAAYYFNEFEEAIKDCFRLMWAVPAVRDALSTGSHMFHFLAEYLLSFKDIPLHLTSIEHGASEEDVKLLKVIRTVFEQQFQQYITPLYNWNPEMSNHAKCVRTGPLVYILLDLVSGRKKLKKKKEDEEQNGTNNETKKDAKKRKSVKEDLFSKFSTGFLDKAQWKLIKDASEDDTISSIVVISNKPFLHLYDLPDKFQEPTEIRKGECLEWCPTYNDLRLFFQYFIDWINPTPGKPVLHKNFVVVGSHIFPFTTQIQDLRSGSKLQQICVGRGGTEEMKWKRRMNEMISKNDQVNTAMKNQPSNQFAFAKDANAGDGDADAAASATKPTALQTSRRMIAETNGEPYDGLEGFRMDDIILTGRLGKRLRYLHKFTELDHLFINPDRDSFGTNSQDKNRDLLDVQIQSVLKPSFASLNFTFDTWRALGVFKVYDDSPRSHPLTIEQDDSARLLMGPILGPPRLYMLEQINASDGSVFSDNVFEVGIMLETDRDTEITFEVRHSLRGDVHTFKFDVRGRKPFVCRIGPLEPNARFDAKIVKGLRETACLSSPFVLSTLVNESESNVVMLNCEFPKEQLPKADFPKDVLKRMLVPFNGLTVTVHMNSIPDEISNLLDQLKRLSVLKNGIHRCFQIKHLTVEFYHVLADVMETIRNLFRRHFSRPSYTDLLKLHFTLLMQTRNIFGELEMEAQVEEDDDDDDGDVESLPDELPPDETLRLLKLMSMRVYQEYVEQLNTPDANIFQAKKPNEEDAVDVRYLSEAEQQRLADEYAVKELIMRTLDLEDTHDDEFDYKQFNKHADPVKVCFKQWLMGLEPADPVWRTYTTPNQKVVIEMVPCALKKNLPKVLQLFKVPCPIDVGSRIVVVDSNIDGSGLDNALTPKVKVGAKYHLCAKKWLYPNPLYPDGEQVLLPPEDGDNEPIEMQKEVIRDDRRVCFISPSSKWGTDKKFIEMVPEHERSDGPHSIIYTVDSMYKSNEAERNQKIMQIEAETANALKSQDLPKASTKKAKEKQREAEELRKKQKMKEFAEAMNSITPDGYVIVECNTHAMPVNEGYGKDHPPDVITTLDVRLLPSVAGGLGTEAEDKLYLDPTVQRPSPYDYIDLPDWINKFFPSKEGVFAQDEVLLWMRQNRITSRILHILEGEEIVTKVIELYEQSRLSELSRPEDLREVDMSLPGVTGKFLKDVVERLWVEVLPQETKELLVPVNDDFLRSFLLARALPNPEVSLASSEAFARGIQYMLTLAVSMKISFSMLEDERYHHLLKEPDAATVVAQFMADRDEKHRLAKEKEKLIRGENPLTPEEEAALAKEKRKKKLLAQAAKAKEAELAEKKKKKKKGGDGDKEEDKEEEKDKDKEAKDDEDSDSEGPNYDTDGNESDLEALEKENDWVLAQEARNEEEEEMNDRMLEFDEAEAEELEAAKETLGLNDAEEEEEEEVEFDVDAMDEDERELYEQQMAEKKAEEDRKAIKTPAQIEREEEATMTMNTILALQEATTALMDLCFDDVVDMQVRDEVYDLDQAEKLKALALPPPQFRMNSAKLHITRMTEERRKVRRNIGPKIMHMK